MVISNVEGMKKIDAGGIEVREDDDSGEMTRQMLWGFGDVHQRSSLIEEMDAEIERMILMVKDGGCLGGRGSWKNWTKRWN